TSFLSTALSRRITNASIAWPVVSSWAPTTAASATLECATSADSISAVDIRCPETLSTSSTRPRTQISPSSSILAPSPAKQTPGYCDQYVFFYSSSYPH